LVTVNDSVIGPIAMTINSFSSVSLEPPLVLWSIQNDSDCFAAFTECEHFALSVLNSDQAALSSQFAKRGEHQTDHDHFSPDTHGVPVVNDALAVFSCAIDAVYAAGDHHIIVGRVSSFQTASGAPLLFHSGQYRELASG
jgi:flavin reductase (DIM6/NTAB) family NADH-FMN oxidoreductase RutF